jgi:ribosomal protein L31E
VTGVDAQSALEAAGRECALRLLEVSTVYEDVTVPAASPREWPVVVALVGRQRRHMTAVVTLADAGLFLEAEIVVRTMLEFRIRQVWLLQDLGLNRLLWLRDEIDGRFTIDRETREWAQTKGRQAVEILRDDVRRRFEQERAQIDALIDGIVTERGLARRPRFPSLQQQADAVDAMIDYTLAYRIDSRNAAHPSPMALQNLMVELPGGDLRVLAEPQPGIRLNVYGVGAYQLLLSLDSAGELIPQLAVDSLDEIAKKLAEISKSTPGRT